MWVLERLKEGQIAGQFSVGYKLFANKMMTDRHLDSSIMERIIPPTEKQTNGNQPQYRHGGTGAGACRSHPVHLIPNTVKKALVFFRTFLPPYAAVASASIKNSNL